MKNTALLVVALASVLASAQTKSKANLSDDYAKAAIKYVIALQNFESNATESSIAIAEGRIESAKENMEASETTCACSEETIHVSPDLCNEHHVSMFLEMQGLTHTTVVKTYHLSFTPEAKAKVDDSNACLDAWKSALQQRNYQSNTCDAKK